MVENIDFFIGTGIKSTAAELNDIFEMNIFTDTDYEVRTLQKCVFVNVMILLNDLLRKAERYGKSRISFNDDIEPSDKVKDITDLIAFVRNAVCYIDSDNHKIDTIKITYCVIVGKGNLLSIGDTIISSPYEDDVCFVYGRYKVYLVRHIYRAFNEALESLSEYL